ncbi:MAG: competence protein CoiA [Chlamydiales bacterium]|jgi:competence protein CoiA
MQITSLDKKGKLIFASRAIRHHDYICIECGKIVRLRGGIHRQKHFFHLSPSKHCRQNGKGMTHLRIQEYLFSLFGPENCGMEARFSNINRIADLVWWKEKLVFEIQYSPISASEVEERNKDYASEGFQVIWILHDKNFNQCRLSAAEIFLRNAPYYFSNIDINGRGYIYDQFDIFHNGLRLFQSEAINITPTTPKKINYDTKQYPLPIFIKNRLTHWPIHFSEDILSKFLSAQEKPHHVKILTYIDQSEKQFKEKHLPIPEKITPFYLFSLLYGKILKRPFIILFRFLLERACRS